MLNVVRASILLLLVVLGGCAQRDSDLVMVDQRTGVKVACQFDEDKSLTSVGVVRRAYTCIDELQYYGFRDDELINPRGE